MKHLTIFNFLIISTLLIGHNGVAQTSPIPITSFEDETNYKEFIYSGPEGVKVNFTSRFVDDDTSAVQHGETSREFVWNFEMGHYFGWGLDLRKSNKGFDASKMKTLTFWLKNVNNGRRFQIKIKDTIGKESEVKSKSYTTNTGNWQKICIPLSDFGIEVNFSRLENINMGFNYEYSGSQGHIYIDNFKFEFQNCK